MLNNSDVKKEQDITPLLRLGFRPFFLFGGIFALVAMLVWLLTLQGAVSLKPFNGATWWHSHEMIFGFVPAIVAGFLLTAVQTWTSTPSIKGNKLLCLFIVWLLARVLLFINPPINQAIVIAIDLAFLPLVALFLGMPIFRVKQYRNMIFMPLLVLMTLANGLSYLPLLGFNPAYAISGLHGMVLLVTFLVAFLGGRVIPMFSANGTGTVKILPLKWLEIASLSSLVLVFIALISGWVQNATLLAGLCLMSALLNFYRQLRWRPWVAFKVPLVWSLHLSMLFLPLGLLLMSIHYVVGTISLSTALHSLTVGMAGGMILAMMSRVSLGHTGRKLNVGVTMSIGFMAIIGAALARSIFVAIWPEYSLTLWLIAGGLWCIAFSCFVVNYFPILSAPRIDGKLG